MSLLTTLLPPPVPIDPFVHLPYLQSLRAHAQPQQQQQQQQLQTAAAQSTHKPSHSSTHPSHSQPSQHEHTHSITSHEPQQQQQQPSAEQQRRLSQQSLTLPDVSAPHLSSSSTLVPPASLSSCSSLSSLHEPPTVSAWRRSDDISLTSRGGGGGGGGGGHSRKASKAHSRTALGFDAPAASLSASLPPSGAAPSSFSSPSTSAASAASSSAQQGHVKRGSLSIALPPIVLAQPLSPAATPRPYHTTLQEEINEMKAELHAPRAPSHPSTSHSHSHSHAHKKPSSSSKASRSFAFVPSLVLENNINSVDVDHNVRIDWSEHEMMFRAKLRDYVHRLTRKLQENLQLNIRELRVIEMNKTSMIKHELRELLRFYHANEGDMYDHYKKIRDQEHEIDRLKTEKEELKLQRNFIESDYLNQVAILQLQMNRLEELAKRKKLKKGDGYYIKSVLTFTDPVPPAQSITTKPDANTAANNNNASGLTPEELNTKLEELQNLWKQQFSSIREKRQLIQQHNSELLNIEKTVGHEFQVAKMKEDGLFHTLTQLNATSQQQTNVYNMKKQELLNIKNNEQIKQEQLRINLESEKKRIEWMTKKENEYDMEIENFQSKIKEFSVAHQRTLYDLEHEYFQHFSTQIDGVSRVASTLNAYSSTLDTLYVCVHCNKSFTHCKLVGGNTTLCELCAFALQQQSHLHLSDVAQSLQQHIKEEKISNDIMKNLQSNQDNISQFQSYHHIRNKTLSSTTSTLDARSLSSHIAPVVAVSGDTASSSSSSLHSHQSVEPEPSSLQSSPYNFIPSPLPTLPVHHASSFYAHYKPYRHSLTDLLLSAQLLPTMLSSFKEQMRQVRLAKQQQLKEQQMLELEKMQQLKIEEIKSQNQAKQAAPDSADSNEHAEEQKQA